MMIRPFVFHGPTGMKSIVGPGADQAVRLASGLPGSEIPHPMRRLHSLSRAAAEIPCSSAWV